MNESTKTRFRVIVLASQKGGAGKTTLAAHVAVAAEAAGAGPAVLIDTVHPAMPSVVVERPSPQVPPRIQ